MTGTTHATARRWRRGAAGLLAAGALPVLATPALAQQGGFYVGLPAAVERLDVRCTGWTAGAGVEQRLGGNAALRGELHYTGYGSTDRVIPYDDLAIQVPIALEASGMRFQVSLLWYF